MMYVKKEDNERIDRGRVTQLSRWLIKPTGPVILGIEEILIIFCIFFFISLWINLILAELTLFYLPLVLFTNIAIFIMYIILFIKYRNMIVIRWNRMDVIAIMITCFFVIFNLIFVHDSFYGGRDPGVFSNAAMGLLTYHGFVIDEYLNFPGWLVNDVGVELGFHYGYCAYLGALNAFFGITGIQIGNAIPMFLFCLSSYFIVKKLTRPELGLCFIIFIMTTFPMFWFTRSTYNEIFSMGLIWSSILGLFQGYEMKRSWPVFMTILGMGYLAHVRIEGVVFFGIMIILIILMRYIFKIGGLVSKKTWVALVLICIHFIIYSLYIQTNYPDYVGIFTNLYRELTNLVSSNCLDITIAVDPLRNHFIDFTFRILTLYFLSWPIFFLPIALLISIMKINETSSVLYIIMFIIIIPSFIYLIIPYISLDQPWFLRRYIDTIIPFAIISALFVSFNIYHRISKNIIVPKKKSFIIIGNIILIILITINLVIAAPIIFHREYNGMLDNVDSISKIFNDGDLVLVDRYATGDYKLADPLKFVKGVDTLWMGPPGDATAVNLSVLNTNEHDSIYLIANINSTYIFEYFAPEELEPIAEMNISYRKLVPTLNLYWIPGVPADPYDLNYSIVLSEMRIPSEVKTYSYHIIIYKIAQ